MDGPSGAQRRGHRLHANTREFGYLVAMSRTYVVAAALFVFACDADDGPTRPEGCPEPGQFTVEGTVDGRELSVTQMYTSLERDDGCDFPTGRIEVNFGDPLDVRVGVNFEGCLRPGQEIAAHGDVLIRSEDVELGNCPADGMSGTIARGGDGNTYSFVIRDLRRVCMGTITPGEFHGCVTLAE